MNAMGIWHRPMFLSLKSHLYDYISAILNIEMYLHHNHLSKHLSKEPFTSFVNAFWRTEFIHKSNVISKAVSYFRYMISALRNDHILLKINGLVCHSLSWFSFSWSYRYCFPFTMLISYWFHSHTSFRKNQQYWNLIMPFILCCLYFWIVYVTKFWVKND